jgi:predicted RNA binding protein YcfA (HicA-like mRNA interferase family)
MPPKLRKLSGKEVIEILASQGFIQMRQRGSHVVMQRRAEGASITVPVPMLRELKIGTLLSIIRQSALARALFETTD